MNQVLLWGTLLVVVSAVAAGGLVLVLQRFLPSERRDGEVDAIGFVFAVVGVLYAIVLAFVIIDVWSKMTIASENTYSEANALVEEYWYAQSLPTAQRSEIERLCQDYAAHVIDEEWPAMREHERAGLGGWGVLDKLRSAVEASRPGLAPATPSQVTAAASGVDGEAADAVTIKAAEDAYAHAVEQVQVLSAAREVRISTATEGVPAVVWFVLIGGGLLTVAFTYLFDIAGTSTQVILAIGLTSMVVLLLFAVYQMEYPFGRQLEIAPDAFKFAQDRFTQMTRPG